MQQPRRALLVLASLIAVVFALASACGDTGVDQPDASTADAAPSPSCLEAVNHSDLEWLEDNVFTPSCSAFSPCHKGPAASAGGLNLEAGNIERNLVGEPSLSFPERTLVVPGDPDNSYLMVILGSREGPLPEEGTMPYNNPLLCSQKRAAIERWIVSLSEPDAGVADAGVTDAQ
jgi:hypothetical protein